MKKSDIILAKLGRGAASTVLATALAAHSQTAETALLVPADDAVLSCPSVESKPGNATESSVNWVCSSAPSEWDKKLEREFRKLALLEAQELISKDDSRRLEELNRWRNELEFAPTADDILLQLKRDHLLSKMGNLLREYVEFEESANKKRFAA